MSLSLRRFRRARRNDCFDAMRDAGDRVSRAPLMATDLPRINICVAVIAELTFHMSCRNAVNMAKRAAAGSMRVSVWLEEETDNLSHAAANLAPIYRSKRQRAPRKTMTLRHDLGRLTAITFSVLAALSFVSYAVCAHQWSELSAFRHLGEASPGK
jgi:hypothetical protein